jgi:hypothetical protein
MNFSLKETEVTSIGTEEVIKTITDNVIAEKVDSKVTKVLQMEN